MALMTICGHEDVPFAAPAVEIELLPQGVGTCGVSPQGPTAPCCIGRGQPCGRRDVATAESRAGKSFPGGILPAVEP